MGAGSSTNTANKKSIDKNVTSPNSSPAPSPALLPEDPSLSAASIDSPSRNITGPISPTDSFSPISVELIAEDVSTNPKSDRKGVVTLWKPEDQSKADREDGVYIEGSATIILAPTKKKRNKSCRCSCCRRRSRQRRRAGDEDVMDSQALDCPSVTSSDNFDDYTTAEVISLHSTGDIVIIPSEVFPLEMITTPDFPLPVDPGAQSKRSVNARPRPSGNNPRTFGAPARPSATQTQKAEEAVEKKVVQAKPKKQILRRIGVPEKPDKPMSLWGLIRSAMGKDITKFPLPVNFAEPLSMLQRLAEDYEYSSVLDRASKTKDSLEQLAYVAAFAISSYASTAVRTAKPFNPLLGETYECDRTDDYGWRLIAEQVCHHPPIAVLHCESSNWVQWQQFTMKSNFRGTYLEINPLGVAHLRFKTSDNHYTWHKVSTIVRNLYIGKLYIEQEGEMDIINHTTNEWCHLKFTCGGMFSRDKNVTGKIFNKASEPKWDLTGTWDKEVSGVRLDEKGKPIPGDSRILWGTEPLPADAEKHYWFSRFACQLNDMEEGVAPTDSRNRTDQRLMENAQWDEANIEKQRLEDKQRESRKKRAQEGTNKHSTASHINAKPIISGNNAAKNAPVSGPEDGIEPFYTPSWFSRQRDPISGQYIYMFTGDYWSCKENQDWERCPVLYDK